MKFLTCGNMSFQYYKFYFYNPESLVEKCLTSHVLSFTALLCTCTAETLVEAKYTPHFNILLQMKWAN